MKDVITNTSITNLTPEELQDIFGGSDDHPTVLDGVLDPNGVVITEVVDI